MTKLTAKNISYKIKGTKILDDVSLSVDAGEHVVIIGPNGAGKSTLFSLITRSREPEDGRGERSYWIGSYSLGEYKE